MTLFKAFLTKAFDVVNHNIQNESKNWLFDGHGGLSFFNF